MRKVIDSQMKFGANIQLLQCSINALENHGLDRCLDHGVHGFKRYVGLAVLARNIQIIGHILQQKELQRVQKLERRQGKQVRAVL